MVHVGFCLFGSIETVEAKQMAKGGKFANPQCKIDCGLQCKQCGGFVCLRCIKKIRKNIPD